MRKCYRFTIGVILTAGMVLMGTYFLFDVDSMRALEKEKSPVYESKHKELVIYEGNLAYAKDEVQIYPAHWIQVSVPQTLIARTLNIVDGGNKIGNFYFTAQAQGSPQVIKWQSESGKSRKAVLNYLLSGLAWSPVYHLDILSDTSVNLLYRVAVSNQTVPFSNVNVKLVSGVAGKTPNISEKSLRISNYSYGLSMKRSERINNAPTRVNAYYTYELGQIESLDKGINYFTLLDKKLEAEKEFIWLTSEGERVDVTYTFKNSGEQPFTAGIADTYQNGIYIGSDTVEWIPPGDKGNVTIGGIADLKVKKTISFTKIPERKHNNEYHHEVELKVESFSKENIKVKIIDNKYSDCVDIAFSLKPAEEKTQTYVWRIKLKGGKSRTIKYDFYSDSTYSK